MNAFKAIIVFALLVGLSLQSSGQKLRNYGVGGSKIHSFTDFLSLDSLPKSTSKVATGLIVAVVGTGISVYNTIREKKQKSYTGVYSNVFALSSFPEGPFSLYRFMLWDNLGPNYSYRSQFASKFEFDIDSTGNKIQISLRKVLFNYSKACFKNQERLAISIALKLTSFDEKGAAVELGESNIIIPIIYVRKEQFDFTTKAVAATTIASDCISKATFSGLPHGGKTNLVLSASFQEVNLEHLDPSLIEQILKTNGSDLTEVLKAALKVD